MDKVRFIEIDAVKKGPIPSRNRSFFVLFSWNGGGASKIKVIRIRAKSVVFI